MADPDLDIDPDHSGYDVRLLGPVQAIHSDGTRIDIGGPKPRLVLVQLALNPDRVVSSESLIDALWGEDPPQTARRTLQAHVAKLRAALGGADGPLQPEAPGYVLRIARSQVDVLRIEDGIHKARSVLDLDPNHASGLIAACRADWVGEPLADLSDHDPTVALRQRLDLLGQELAELELDSLLAVGEHANAIRGLERLVTERPEHEPYWARLMTAYYRTGRQADALEAYQRARAALAEHLGIAPSVGLQQLEASVLNQDTDLIEHRSEVCPYRGLASYQVDDSEVFYGREGLIEQLLEVVRRSQTCVVVGPSGVGKSSVLRAGLVHRINSGADPDVRSASVIIPGRQPLRSLYQAPPDTDLLIIDQFEELFTLTDDVATRLLFISEALEMVDSGRVRLVISIRADFYGHCAAIPMLAPVLTHEQVIVAPLSEQDLRDAVLRPAERAGFEVEASLVDAIVEEGVDRPGTLPLISHALVETWRRREGSTLTLASYRDAGSIAGAIADTAERLYDSLQGDEQQQLERLFLRLVEPAGGTVATRRSISSRELDGVAVHESLIDRLVASRLLTASTDHIDIAHEALIGAWPRLTEWIDNHRDGIRTHRHLANSALAWDDLGRDDSELYRGHRLSGASSWAQSSQRDLSDLERDFIAASQRASESDLERRERTNRRLRILVSVAVVALVAATVATLLAVGSAREAERHSSEIETAQLVSNLRADETRSQLATLRLAAAAEQRTTTPASRGLLLDSLLAVPAEIAHGTIDALIVGDAATTANGGILVTVDNLMRGQIRSAETTEVRVRDLDFVPLAAVDTGTRLLVVEQDTLRVIDLETGEVIATPTPRQLHRGGVALSPDGQLLAVVSGPEQPTGGSGAVELIDVSSGDSARTLIDEDGGRASSVQFNATGTTVLAVLDGLALAVWDVDTGDMQLRSMGDPEYLAGITIAVFAPGGDAVAIGRTDGAVETWRRDGASWQRLSLASPHDAAVSWIEFDAAGDLLVSSARDGSIVVRDGTTGAIRRGPIVFASNGALRSFFTAESGLSSIDSSGHVWRWSAEASGGLITLKDIPTAGIDSVEGGIPQPLTTSDAVGNRAASVAASGEIVVVDRDGDVVEVIAVADVRAPLQSLSLNPDGSELVFSSALGELVWYELAPGIRAEVVLPAGEGYDGHFLADGTLIAVGSSGIRVLDPENPTSGETLDVGHDAVRVALGPSQNLAATVDPGGGIRLWDVPSLQPIGSNLVMLPGDAVGPIRFSANDTRLAQIGTDSIAELSVDPGDWRTAACLVLMATAPDGPEQQELARLGLDGPCE